jgi:anti-sigma regulatory factor (Ser/Thr protein kinase)
MASEPDEARVADDRTGPASIADLRRDAVPADVDQLPPLRHQLAGWAACAGLTADQVDALILAVYEAMSNAVSQRPGAVHVTVRDRGRWREPVDRGPLHGRGLILIRALAQEVRFEQTTDGTSVHMVWPLP